MDYFVSLAFCVPRLGLDIFAFVQQCLTKKLEEKAVDRFLFLFGFYTQQTVNSAADLVFTSKFGLPRVVPVLWWVSFVRQIFVPPRSEKRTYEQ